jgi:hypothetical protein
MKKTLTGNISFLFLILTLVLSACNLPLEPQPSTPVFITNTPLPPTPVPSTLSPSPEISPTSTSTPDVSQPGTLSLEMLLNGTYQTPFYDRTVTLVNGFFTQGSGADIFSVQMLPSVAFGDLDGDGKEDAAIILAENGGGTGTFESLIVLLNQNGIPHQTSDSTLGDRQVINSMDISSGVIHLDMVVHGPNDPMCCPSLPQKHNYWLISGKLWLMRVATTINGTSHIINIDSPALWASVENPFTVSGTITVLPFENTLAYHIYLVDGTNVNDYSLFVTPSTGISGTFSQTFNLSAAGITDWVIIQFVDVSAADGSTIALGSIILKAH